MFPVERPRRLRQTAALRNMVRETTIQTAQLIYPLFIKAGSGRQDPIRSMPGIYQWSVDRVGEHVAEVYERGVTSFLLFGIPADKDSVGSSAYDPDGIVQDALRTLKKTVPAATLRADL